MKARPLITAAFALAALALPTVANAADRDKDGMRDSWEKHNGLSTKKNDARKDRDRDGLRNIGEYRSGTNPRKADTDGDGTRDGDEGGGRVASFDSATGVLTINLFAGGTLTGKVDATTKVECEGDDDDRPAPAPTTAARRGADDAPGSDSNGGRSGDNSGPGSDNSGRDDNEVRHGDDDDDGEGDCSTADLTVGRIVQEADLNEGDDGPADVFDEIELG
jgi:hypothetical protein